MAWKRRGSGVIAADTRRGRDAGGRERRVIAAFAPRHCGVRGASARERRHRCMRAIARRGTGVIAAATRRGRRVTAAWDGRMGGVVAAWDTSGHCPGGTEVDGGAVL